jgi:ubiquitin-like-conjugating enzyme ATG3
MTSAVKEIGKDIVRGVATIPSRSTFSNDGKIIPAEFIKAGDYLKSKNPQWHWCAGDPAKALNYLPPDKQFLELKGVPCRARAASLKVKREEKLVGSGDDEFVLSGEDVAPSATSSASTPSTSAEPEEEIFDFEDDSAVSTTKKELYRTYDATITYDLYYNSPRLYLMGKDEEGKPLTKEQIFEDLAEEYAKKTASVDPHPHLGIPAASVHPCKHAASMKATIDREKDLGSKVDVEQYFFYFLKFVGSAIPTIELGDTVETE